MRGLSVGRLLLGKAGQRFHLVLVQHRRSGAPEGDPWAGADAATGAAAPGGSTACWLPIIQPAMRPNTTPAIPNAIDSGFMECALDHTGSGFPGGREGDTTHECTDAQRECADAGTQGR